MSDTHDNGTKAEPQVRKSADTTGPTPPPAKRGSESSVSATTAAAGAALAAAATAAGTLLFSGDDAGAAPADANGSPAPKATGPEEHHGGLDRAAQQHVGAGESMDMFDRVDNDVASGSAPRQVATAASAPGGSAPAAPHAPRPVAHTQPAMHTQPAEHVSDGPRQPASVDRSAPARPHRSDRHENDDLTSSDEFEAAKATLADRIDELDLGDADVTELRTDLRNLVERADLAPGQSVDDALADLRADYDDKIHDFAQDQKIDALIAEQMRRDDGGQQDDGGQHDDTTHDSAEDQKVEALNAARMRREDGREQYDTTHDFAQDQTSDALNAARMRHDDGGQHDDAVETMTELNERGVVGPDVGMHSPDLSTIHPGNESGAPAPAPSTPTTPDRVQLEEQLPDASTHAPSRGGSDPEYPSGESTHATGLLLEDDFDATSDLAAPFDPSIGFPSPDDIGLPSVGLPSVGLPSIDPIEPSVALPSPGDDVLGDALPPDAIPSVSTPDFDRSIDHVPAAAAALADGDIPTAINETAWAVRHADEAIDDAIHYPFEDEIESQFDPAPQQVSDFEDTSTRTIEDAPDDMASDSEGTISGIAADQGL